MWAVLDDKQALVTTRRLPEIPGAPLRRLQVDGRDVTVAPHTHTAWEALRHAGLNPPSPLRYYDWPGRHKPMQHQRSTVEHLISHRKAFCLNGLGTGKTLSNIWAADYLQKQGAVRRVLVVAPLSICSYVWERELFTTLPRRTVAVCRGSRRRKLQMAADTRIEWLIVNPESLGVIADHLRGVDLVIVDEFTKFKNARSQRTKVLRKLSRSTRLWLNSGTPAPQSPLDAYGPMTLVRDKPMSFTAWRDMTMVQVSEFKWLPREGVEETIARHLQPAVRYRREDCYDMPDVSVQELEVDLTPAQDRFIKEIRKEAAAELAGQTITAANAAAVLIKILQVMGGGVYDEDGRTHQVSAEPFYEAIEEVVDQADTPVLIFVPFRSAATAVHERLEKAGYNVGKIVGGTNTTTRRQVFDGIQNRQLDACVAVASTMSHGLTLTEARYVLWACPPYSYEDYEQANGRVIRNGQRNDVVIYHLIQNTLARELFGRLQSKARLQDTVLNIIGGEHGC